MLTKDAFKRILANQSERLSELTVQILEIKVMQGDTIVLLISDSDYFMDATLSSAYLNLIKSHQLVELQVILIEDYVTLNSEGRLSMNILSIQPKSIERKLGSPQSISKIIQKMAEEYTPISALSTFLYDWTIKAKVLKKSELKEFTSKKTGRQEKLMSVGLLDSNNTRITASFFAEAAEKFHPIIDEGKVYLFSNGNVALAEQKYRTPECNYQLSFNPNSQITLAPDQNFLVANVTRVLTPISKIRDMPEKSLIDICGVVIEIGPVQERVSKKGSDLRQRVLKLVDTTNTSIELSLWNDLALSHKLNDLEPKKSIIHAKGVLISFFNNTLTLSSSKELTELDFHPTISYVNELQQWLDSKNPETLNSVELSERKDVKKANFTLKSVADLQEAYPNPNDRYLVIGYVFLKNTELNLAYESCQSCKKKVTKEGDFFSCMSCKKTSKDCSYRYLLRSLSIADFSGSVYTTAFNEAGEAIFKMSASEFIKKSDEDKKELIIKASLNQFAFLIRVLSGNTQEGNPRIEYTVGSVSHLNYPECTKKILELINSGIS